MADELRYIVRLLGTDLDGSVKLPFALARIRGVDITLAYSIARALGIDPEARVGQLPDGQIQRIQEAIKDPVKYGVPAWFVNRRKDPVSGKDLNLTGADLDLALKEDIQREIRVKSWRGVRHSLGLKVRGQRTRTTGRKYAAVGVSKKVIEEAMRAKTQKESSS